MLVNVTIGNSVWGIFKPNNLYFRLTSLICMASLLRTFSGRNHKTLNYVEQKGNNKKDVPKPKLILRVKMRPLSLLTFHGKQAT